MTIVEQIQRVFPTAVEQPRSQDDITCQYKHVLHDTQFRTDFMYFDITVCKDGDICFTYRHNKEFDYNQTTIEHDSDISVELQQLKDGINHFYDNEFIPEME